MVSECHNVCTHPLTLIGGGGGGTRGFNQEGRARKRKRRKERGRVRERDLYFNILPKMQIVCHLLDE